MLAITASIKNKGIGLAVPIVSEGTVNENLENMFLWCDTGRDTNDVAVAAASDGKNTASKPLNKELQNKLSY